MSFVFKTICSRHSKRLNKDEDCSEVETAIAAISPDVIVTVASARNDPQLMNTIRKSHSPTELEAQVNDFQHRSRDPADFKEHEEETESPPDFSYQSDIDGTMLELLPVNMFSLESANQSIGTLSLPGMPSFLSARERIAYLENILDLDSQVCFRCIGGLLWFLFLRVVENPLNASSHQLFFLNCIDRLNIKNVLHMSRCTMKAIQLFKVDRHPLSCGSGRAKESLSVYGLLNLTRSASGSRLLRTWISAPSTDIKEIEERQKLIAYLKSPASENTYRALQDALSHVKNIPMVLGRLRAISASVNDWSSLQLSVCAFLKILHSLRNISSEPSIHSLSILRNLDNIDEASLHNTSRWISEVIDFQESKALGKLVVVSGFSYEIDQMRECYAGLDDFLTTCAVNEMNRIAAETSICIPLKIVYISQVGYLVVLDNDFLSSPLGSEENLALAGLELSFRSPPYESFFKSSTCEELDRNLGDIHGALVDLEAKAVRYLEGKILPVSSSLYAVCRLAAEIDCLLALATVAKEHNWSCPVVVDIANGIHIEQGRHALQDVIIPSFIPNDTIARPGSVHVITGPNSSGKSVYCKQVAIIVVLAQIGSCVPAKACRLGIVDAIYTRISSLESISLSQSSFFIDASQVAGMLRNATAKSLVILDEWGKGTVEAEGMALFAATLNELLGRQREEAPFCFAATHFTDILSEQYLPMSNDRLCTFSMEYTVERSEFKERLADLKANSHDRLLNEQTVYLYQLIPGSICAESRAIQCALTAGVPRTILSRSAEVGNAVRNQAMIPVTDIDGGRIQLILKSVRKFINWDPEDGCVDIREFLNSMDI
jgi:DNA mismatch repair protein MSH5